ncbi:MAG: hypothetical protein NZ455_16865 [Bacteroidia bacterium]|nr:hypothetical protein [Bacteroidia bacterium]
MRRVCAAQCEAPKRKRSPKHADPAHLRAAQRVQGHARRMKLKFREQILRIKKQKVNTYLYLFYEKIQQ